MPNKPRLRDLDITIGEFPTGTHNAITDVPGVAVGHTTLNYNQPRIARTGVTVILPRPRQPVGEGLYYDHCFAGYHSFNGNGEMTGVHWLEESGILGGPVAITNTHQVGVVRDALAEHEVQSNPETEWCLPVVAETYDGFLNDINGLHVRKEHVLAALATASTGAVSEGNVGGGTGMICHGFKGGIGTSSRLVETASGNFTVGALVQANYGARKHLRINGAPIGQQIGADKVSLPSEHDTAPTSNSGSIIVVIATDAPLLPVQCKRLARRATVGLARVGGTGYNGSGDIFLAFATGNHVPIKPKSLLAVQMLPLLQMNPLFDVTAEAVEEAILNALCAAETMTGFQGRVVHALPLELVKELLK